MRTWSSRRLALAIEALFWLYVGWMSLRLLPFRVLEKYLRPRVLGQKSVGQSNDVVVRDVVWAISAAVRRSPFPMVCFPQGIAAQRMLCRRGIPAILYYGVKRAEDGAVLAHVWVNALGRTVVGGDVGSEYGCITSFDPL